MKESGDNLARTGSSVSIAGYPTLQVEALSEIASGLQFLDDGSLVAVNEERRSNLTKQLKDLAQGLGPNARFIRRFFSSGGDRTVFPASDVKVAGWVDNALLTNPDVTEQWLRDTLVFLPDHPLVHIALAGFETDPKRADFLRAFGLARLPKSSAVCTHATEMLLAQANTLNNLGNLDRAQNRMDQARQKFEEALKIYRGLAQQNAEAHSLNVVQTLNNLALLDVAQRRKGLARQRYEEMLKILETFERRDPEGFSGAVQQVKKMLKDLLR